ncbi:unnamed protein product [Natator depressus]
MLQDLSQSLTVRGQGETSWGCTLSQSSIAGFLLLFLKRLRTYWTSTRSTLQSFVGLPCWLGFPVAVAAFEEVPQQAAHPQLILTVKEAREGGMERRASEFRSRS